MSDPASPKVTREWKLLRSICKRILSLNATTLQALDRWFNKEADASERKLFAMVMSGVFNARRSPPVSPEHPMYATAAATVSNYGKGTLTQAAETAAISWLCRNPDLRDTFVTACASISICQKPYLSNYASTYVPHKASPFKRFQAPASTGFITTQGVSLTSAMMLRDVSAVAHDGVGLEGPSSSSALPSQSSLKEKLKPKNSRTKRTTKDPSATADGSTIPTKSLKARLPWPTFDFSMNGLKSAHQDAFGQPHNAGRCNLRRNELLFVAHAPTGPAGQCSTFYDPDMNRFERQRTKIRKECQAQPSITLTFTKLPTLKPPLPSPKPLVRSTRHGKNPDHKQYTEMYYPWDSQGEEYLRDIMQSTYHAEIDRSAERVRLIREHQHQQRMPSSS